LEHNEIEFRLRYPSRTLSWIWSPKTFFFHKLFSFFFRFRFWRKLCSAARRKFTA